MRDHCISRKLTVYRDRSGIDGYTRRSNARNILLRITLIEVPFSEMDGGEDVTLDASRLSRDYTYVIELKSMRPAVRTS